MARTLTSSPTGTIEHDGMLWKPRRGATSTAEEFIAARTMFWELHRDGTWNPWVLNDREGDLDRAGEVMSQWRRAEPGHRTLTLKQWEARQARRERAREKQRAADEARRVAGKRGFDERRSVARLRLIEVQSRLVYEVAELAGHRDGSRFPAMDSSRRAGEVKKLEEAAERLRREVDELTPIVGDPEAVVDEHGWLPRDRREQTWWSYRLDRECQVRDLREQLSGLTIALGIATDRGERRDLRAKLADARRDHDRLIAAGPFTSEEMCSECATPMAHHGWVWPPGTPCPAWPGWAARIHEARRMLAATVSLANPQIPQAPKAQPLAVIPSGLPIGDVLGKLSELQEQFPSAEVRRGRANRWELWPPADGG